MKNIGPYLLGPIDIIKVFAKMIFSSPEYHTANIHPTPPHTHTHSLLKFLYFHCCSEYSFLVVSLCVLQLFRCRWPLFTSMPPNELGGVSSTLATPAKKNIRMFMAALTSRSHKALSSQSLFSQCCTLGFRITLPPQIILIPCMA
jgi:hypothetical protein